MPLGSAEEPQLEALPQHPIRNQSRMNTKATSARATKPTATHSSQVISSVAMPQRFSRWAKSGVFERIFKQLGSDYDSEYMMLDATIVRAHQHSAGARKKTASKRSADPAAD